MRKSFTLVEMLVALGILAILATLAVAILPKIQERVRALRGAEQLQGWLLLARNRALRDRYPSGLRLLPDADGFVRSFQYIEEDNIIYNLNPRPTSGVHPIAGEYVLLFPDYVVVDLAKSKIQDLGTGGLDVLFAPSGMLSRNWGGKIILWVRDESQDADQPGSQILIVVYPNTGRIAGIPVNTDQNVGKGDPYWYVYDKRNSGI